MKAIISIILGSLLSGCAAYSYPLYDDGQGVSYEDPIDAPASTTSTYYIDSGIYPWRSMDYFYLGYAGYRPWAGSDYYYSPYFYPYYFSVLYPPWHWQSGYPYGGYSFGYDVYWHHRYRPDQAAPYAAVYRGSGNHSTTDHPAPGAESGPIPHLGNAAPAAPLQAGSPEASRPLTTGLGHPTSSPLVPSSRSNRGGSAIGTRAMTPSGINRSRASSAMSPANRSTANVSKVRSTSERARPDRERE
jgi:hypothetical protein